MPSKGREPHRTFNGWRIFFNEPFTTRYGDLSARARHLKGTLAEEEFRGHPDVKLFAAVYKLVYETIPNDPAHRDFRLDGALKKFRRAKGKGLPARYRLFFVFMQSTKTIVFLYMNDARSLRKHGDAKDPYRQFTALVDRGVIGADFEENYRIWRRAHK